MAVAQTTFAYYALNCQKVSLCPQHKCYNYHKEGCELKEGLIVRHHTKDKGDEGLGQVIGDLMTNGVQVAVPLSEHLPFDLIAIGEHGAMRRGQVRYRG